ncbi:PDZ domain-containing protein [Croceitalea marina]|uniref:PDZ domain-containing protein n=1 Tax=Croceitalea marina TaxID=1775166 RepID=A0ABW5MQI2_9FLAO
MLRVSCITCFLLCLGGVLYGQKFQIPPGKKFEKINFELVNNLMIVPVEVNGAKLSFILDSGVSSPILFNITNQDSIQINDVSKITLRGLGEGEPMEALKSRNNIVKLGNAANFKQSLFVVLDKDLNFSTSLGIPVHGIIGYDVFENFIVDVNYTRRYIKLYNPDSYKKEKLTKHQELPLAIYKKKAYLTGAILLEDDSDVPVKLLVDTGSSDALWLFHDPEKGVKIPEKNYDDFLGKGLSGDIFGKRTKLKGVRVGDFLLKDAKAAFPFRESFSAIKNLGNRNGSLGGEVLKRFNMVFDYSNKRIYLKKNANFKTPFQYNFAGIALQHNGLRYISERITNAQGIVKSGNEKDTFGNVQILMGDRTRLSLVPEIIVSGIRAGSPAEEAGLKEGDIILAVNGKRVHQYKLQEILSMINQKEGKKVRLLIERYNRDLLFSFVVKDIFKTKKP